MLHWTFHTPEHATAKLNMLFFSARRCPERDAGTSPAWRLRCYVDGDADTPANWACLFDVTLLAPPDGLPLERGLTATARVWLRPLTNACASITPISLDDLAEQKAKWSLKTFGPGARTRGLVEHIRRELDEILAKPDDLTEPVDVILLAMDLYARAGGRNLLADLWDKHRINTARTWPAPQSEDHPAEHDRGGA